MLGRLAGLLALVACIVATTESTAAVGVAVALAAAVLVATGSRLVVAHRVGGVGVQRGEVATLVPVLSSRIADPVRQPVRPRAPGLV
jgi:hypothetical protein